MGKSTHVNKLVNKLLNFSVYPAELRNFKCETKPYTDNYWHFCSRVNPIDSISGELDLRGKEIERSSI